MLGLRGIIDLESFDLDNWPTGGLGCIENGTELTNHPPLHRRQQEAETDSIGNETGNDKQQSGDDSEDSINGPIRLFRLRPWRLPEGGRNRHAAGPDQDNSRHSAADDQQQDRRDADPAANDDQGGDLSQQSGQAHQGNIANHRGFNPVSFGLDAARPILYKVGQDVASIIRYGPPDVRVM